MFLNEQEIRQLTGYQRPSAQIRWLRAKGYRFTVNGLGEPVVAIAECTRKNVGGASARHQEPKWEAMRGKASA